MKRIIALGAVVLLVVVVWSGAWFWAAGQITGYVKTFETADGVTAPRLTCGSFGVGGFPFGFDLTCANAIIVDLDTTVTVSGIKLSALVYNPTRILAFAQSPVTINDAVTGSSSRIDFADAEGSARLTGWRIGRVSLVVNAPVWNDTVLDEDLLLGKAAQLQVHLIDVPDKHDATAGLATLAGHAEITGLDAPRQEIASGQSTLDAEITNLPDDVRTYGDADLLKRWQAAAGKVLLAGLKGSDVANRFEVTGTLGLDAQGRAEGQLKLNSKGVVERIAPLVPEQFRGLVLGGQAADGSYSQTVNIAAGVVFSGLVPTGVIPPFF